MAISSADGSKILRTYLPEATAGTASAGAYQTLRVKGGVKTDFTRNTFSSNELRTDRQTSSFSYGTKSGQISFPVEWSYGTYEDLMEAVMGGTWTTNVLKVGNTVRTFACEETTSDLSILERMTGCQFGSLSIGIGVDKIAEGDISGVYRGIKIAQTKGVNLAYDSAAKTITRATAGFTSIDGWVNGDSICGLGNTDAGNNNSTPWVITTLTDTAMTFTAATGIVTKITAAGITLNLGTVATSIVAATTTAPFDSFTGSIIEGGATIAYVTGWDLKIDQDIKLNFCIGSDSAQSASVGTIKITGNLSAYFVDEALRKKFANGTATTLSLVLGSVAATKAYTFDLGTVKYTSNTKSSDASAIIQSIGFTATYTAADTTLKITRTP